MLVITRRSQESIMIGDNIEILITDIGNDKVKLCINAPKDISIMRKELLDISDMNKEASFQSGEKSIQDLNKMLGKLKKSE